MAKLILVKHSMPELVPDQPASRWRLSSEGRRRCIPLANRLALYYPAKIFTSPEPKAKDTAQRLAQRLGISYAVNDRLYEHRRETVPFLPEDRFRASVRELFTRPEERVFGEESASEALARFSGAIWRLIEQHPSQTLVVVAHGCVISLFAASVCRLEPYELWKRLDLPSYVVLRLPEMWLEDVVERLSPNRAWQVA